MDTKNVIAAISLSAAVIIIYALFFGPSPEQIKKSQDQKNQITQNSETPSLDVNQTKSKISRKEAIEENERIKFENENIKGSISLIGGTIDDLIFKKYTKTLNGNDKIILLNPKKFIDGYFVETGWVTNNKNIDLPDSNTLWIIEGNNKLSPNNPIKLVWSNNQGIRFEKNIKIDNQFLFTVDQRIINNSEKTYNFYPYGQIIRNKAPQVTNFYILHEGLIGVFDEQLVEQDYEDIKEKKFSKNTKSGWLGITDKYWITTLIPEKNKEFRADFDFRNKFRANFNETNPIEVGRNSSD